MSDSKYLIALIAIIIGAVVMIGVGPLLTLWAINALFQLQIAYTFGNWFATLWLSALFLPKYIRK